VCFNFLPSAIKQSFFVFRDGTDVSLEQLSASEHLILLKLQSGASLITAIEEAQNDFSEVDIGSQIMNGFNELVQ
jgi:hypothetical protein